MVGIQILWHVFTPVGVLLAVEVVVPYDRKAELRALACQIVKAGLLAVTSFQLTRLIAVIHIAQQFQI